MNYKSFIMILLIGSSITFSSVALKESVNKVETEYTESTGNIDVKEVIFWIAILFALGWTVMRLLLIMEIVFKIPLLDPLNSKMQRSIIST